MIRSVLFATLLALGTAGAAQAQAPDASGGSPSGGNVVVGGRAAAIVGGGDSMVILYSTPGAGGGGGGGGWSQAGQSARFAGGDGDGPRVEYTAPAPARTGREAWLLGGGDNAEVVYGRPR